MGAARVCCCQETPASGEDEAAIRRTVASYVDAFNRGDARALAAHWHEGGELVTPAGKAIRGREQLAADFAAYFKETPGAKIELVGVEVNPLSPNVATETGVARVVSKDGGVSETEYEAIHIKTTDGWRIDSVREQERSGPPPTHYERLRDLEWMIGRWTNSDDDSSIEIDARWTANRNFIARTFKVFIQDRLDFEGTQIVGWDPHAQSVRSWVFDSDGGFGVGRWSHADNRWTARTLHVMPDGRRASSTNIYDVVDQDTVRYQSIARHVDGELLPNIDPVVVVRASDP